MHSIQRILALLSLVLVYTVAAYAQLYPASSNPNIDIHPTAQIHPSAIIEGTVKIGFVLRTSSGRKATEAAYKHLGFRIQGKLFS